MPIKKAAAFSLVLATISVAALIFTSYTTASTLSEGQDQMPQPVKCSKQINTNTAPLPWNIVTGNLFQLEV